MNDKISYKVPIILFLSVIGALIIIIWFGLSEIRDIFSEKDVEIRESPLETREQEPYIPFNPIEIDKDKG